MAVLINPDDEGIESAVNCLRAGGIVAFPTESAYALGAWTGSGEALLKLEKLKNRPVDQGFPLLVPSTDFARAMLKRPEGPAWELAEKNWPGGLTLVDVPLRKVPREVSSELGVGIRVTKHPWSKRMVEVFDGSVTCTSANLRGDPPAIRSDEISEKLLHQVDMVVEGNAGGEMVSTVITPRAWGIQVIREGPVEVDKELQITDDRILRGRALVFQPRLGYRFSIDALLLAGFVKDTLVAGKKSSVSAVELGTGCGVVSICLAKKLEEHSIDISVTAYELQNRLGDLAEMNVELNEMSSFIKVVKRDFKTLADMKEKPWVDLVFSNPPYRPVGTGRQSPCKEKELALGETACSMEDVAVTGGALLRSGGVLCVIYPAKRLSELIRVFSGNNLYLQTIMLVYPRRRSAANRVIASFRRGDAERPIDVLPPFIMYEDDGRETSGLQSIVV